MIAWIDLAIENKHERTKGFVGLQDSLEQLDKGEEPRIRGWLKIEEDKSCTEPFMFFVDEEMFNNMQIVFGLREPELEETETEE